MLSIEQWAQINPELADFISKDHQFIAIVDQMRRLSNSEEKAGLRQQGWALLSEMHDFPITDEYLDKKITNTEWLLVSPEAYYEQAEKELSLIMTDIIFGHDRPVR